MKTITVVLNNDEDAELLKDVLSKTTFKEEIETYVEDVEISEEELLMLNERWEQYKASPESALTLEEFKKRLNDKYGK